MATEVQTTAGALDSDARRWAALSAAGVTGLCVLVFSPVLYYMVLHWRDAPDYSHGFLVAPLAVYFAWERRGRLARCPIEPTWWGALPLTLAAACLAVGRLGVELMTMRASFVLALHGIVLLLLGRRVYRTLLFPLLFLFLMIPLPQSLLNVIALPLQLVAADLAVDALHGLALPVLREGNIIHLKDSRLFVAEACSGLRSLMALGTLAVVFAYFFRKKTVERAVLVLSAVPIAILVNSFRVFLTGLLTIHIGKAAADGWIHQTEGFFTFGLALALLLTEAWALQQLALWRRRRGAAA